MKIVIIGAGTGLSRSVAKRFGREGFSVSLVARSEEKLKQEVKLLQEQNIPADYIVADVGDESALLKVLKPLKQKGAHPDVILFNAFINAAGGFEEEDWAHLKVEMDVNVGAAFNTLKEMLPVYVEADKGCLFFTGGGFGITPAPDYLGVSIGKAALRNLVQAAAQQVKDTGVHVATLTVMGFIGGEDSRYAPDRIAEEYWRLFTQQAGEFETELIY